MRADVIDKSTGNVLHVPGNTIDLSSPSIVRLDLDRSQIVSLERQGKNLIIHLANGETIQVANFYVQAHGTASDLVVREGDQGQWLANAATPGAARFTALHGIDELLVAADVAEGGGGGALLPVLLGVAGAAGLGAAVAGGGGGSSGGGGGGPAATADTTPPGAPTANFGSNGASVTGTGEAGATVQVRDPAGAVLGSGVVGSNGSYSVALTQPQTNGQTVTVTQTDPAGNASPATTARAPDATAPGVPTGTINPDGTIITGTGEPGAAVTVRNGSDAVIGTGTVDAQGNYSITLTTPQNNGGDLTVAQADAAGNASNELAIAAPDILAPGAPSATMDPQTFTVSGSAEPGATVTVMNDDGVPIGATVADADGGYTVSLAPSVFDGDPVMVVQTDTGGNDSPPTVVIAPDLAVPDAPSATVTPDGTAVTGTGEVGATVTALDPDTGAPIGTTVVGADGGYSIALPPGTSDGGLIEVFQTDPSGNVSPPTVAVTPDVLAPAAPTAVIAPDGASVAGLGEAGATVTVTDAGGTPIGTATVAGDGSYFIALTPAQANGEALTVSQADGAGNASPPMTLNAPDITAPAAPVASIAADGATVTGTGEAGATVTVRDAAGNPLGTALVAADGSFTATLATPQANGQLLQVSQADPSGNASAATSLNAPDITAPLGLTAVIDASGAIVTGTGEPGATVTVRDPLGTAIGSAIVGADGSYTATIAPAQLNGEVLQVVQADAASNASAPVTVTAPDVTAPAAPSGTVAADGTSVTGTGEAGATLVVRDGSGTAIGTTVVAADGSYTVTLTAPQANGEQLQLVQADVAGNLSPVTSITAPDITAPIGLVAAVDGAGTIVSGSGEAGATVTVRDPLGATIGTALVAANGSYAVVLTTPQTNGQLLQVTQADAAGNPGAPVPALAPDITAPALPSAAVSPDGTVVTGTGEAGATLTVRDPAGTVIGTTVVAGDGSYSVTLTAPQTNGETVTVRQADPAGNVSPDVPAVAPDITAPIGLTATVNGSGTVVSGSGEAGATVTVRDPLGTAIGTAVVAANGAYAVVLTTPQANGELLQVSQADPAGNPSTPVPALAPDITAPGAPAFSVSADGTTVAGTGEPGATVTVATAAGAIIGSGSVAGDGSFSIVLTAPQANGGTLSATQADPAGNVSPPATAPAPDITPPALPAASLDATGAIVTGTGEPGATIVVRDPFATVIGTGVVSANGSFSIVLATPQIDSQILSVVQTDGAGNPSPALPLTAPDLTAPLAPAGTVAGDGASITGTGEPGATLVITDPSGLPIGSVTVAGDGSFTTALIPPQINGETLGLVQTDLAGNASPQGSAVAPDLVPNDSPGAPTATVAADGATVFGTADAGNTVRVTDANGNILGTATVTPGGTYVVILTTPQLNGETVGVIQADAEGDLSPPTTAVAPDLTPPAAPAATIDASGTVVTGTGEVGATVRVIDAGGTVLGTATVGANGGYAVVLAPPQTNGQALSVTQADAAANVSPAAPVTAPDMTAPLPPSATVSGDGATVSGLGEPGATVTITDAGGATLGTVTVTPGGTYTVTLTVPQLDGQVLTAVQADPAGNASPSVTATAPDTTAPAAPTATVDASGLVVTGTGEAGATVTVRDPAGTAIGTGLVAANGSYTATLSAAQLNGQTLQVSQSDPTGNLSPSTPATAPDITAPIAPAGTVAADGLTVTGTGEPGATVTVRDPAGIAIGTALVAGDGSFTAPLATAQVNGQLLSLSQADPTGNLSPSASAAAPDLTAPAAPAATVSTDGTLVTGTGEAGATVTVRDPSGAAIGTALVGASGAYVVVLATPQANGQTLQVTQSDPAGNASPATPALAPDFTAPAAPSATVSADGSTVTGIGEPGATVHIVNAAGTEIGTAIVAGDGSYTAPLAIAQANGETVTVTQSDPAGNPSPATVATAPDITPPAPPTGVAIDGTGTVVTGAGEAGATVEVRDASGTLLGTATVAANGSFAVPLIDPQTAGEALSIALRDPAGNLSGTVPLVAPFDIDAFDNSATASIDLVPVTTSATLGTANYLALVSLGLLNLDAQVLATPTVQFTVAPGHVLDATFTYDALLSIGVLSGYSVAIQRFDGTNWVAVDGAGNNSLLQLGLLNGDLTATETLGPGQYRAFVTFDGAAGVGLLGGLTVTGVNSDYTDVAAANPAAAPGNVITDPGAGGAIDIVSPQTVVQSVTVNGVTSTVVAGGTSVHGSWGTLVLNPDGSYSYTPDANAAAIGHSDSFTYTLVNPVSGELESATLTVAIGSPDITGAPLAVNDSAIATATFQNVVTTIPAAIDSSFATPTALLLNGPQTGTVHDSFTVGPNATADVTLSAIQSSGLSVLPTYTITVTNAAGTVVGTITQAAVLNLGLGTGVSLVLHDLPSGTYNYTVSSTNALGTGYGTNIYVGETVTHLDQHQLVGSTAVTGDLLANDTTGTDFPVVRVQVGGNFVEVGDTPVTITGAHGTLTVDETGHYSYQPSAALAYSGADPVDSFTYQLVQPNGTVATAHLDVAVDINNGVTPVLALAEAVSLADAVPLTLFAAEPLAAPPAADHAPAGYALADGQDSVEDLLGQFLQARQETPDTAAAHAAVSVAPTAVDIAAAPIAEDPLHYLVSTASLDQEHTKLTYVV